MIFKNEGEQRIQKISVDVPGAEKVGSRLPFEYRDELAASDKERMRKEFSKDALFPATQPWLTLSAMKYIGVAVPPIPDKPREQIESGIIPAIQKALDGPLDTVMGLDIRFLVNTALFDVNLLRSTKEPLHSRVQKLIDTLANPTEEASPSWQELAVVRLIAPNVQLEAPPQWVEQLEEMVDLLTTHVYRNDENAWRNAVQDAAYARIAGVHSIAPELFDWARVRQFFFTQMSNQDIRYLAENCFYARVLNAEKVWVDDNGLHIVDSPLEAVSKAPMPVPQQKYL